jgi:diguanylate cyclase (GGDEF)-like protein
LAIVSIERSDINHLDTWPIPDVILADLIEKINQQSPRAIGLLMYRDIPIEPGHDRLIDIYQKTPNLIGIEKAIGETIPPPPVLAENGQVGISDLVLDADGKLRRSLLSIQLDSGAVKENIAVKLALKYLENEQIVMTPIPGESGAVQLGKSVLTPLKENNGYYVGNDVGGYQILLNYRGLIDRFKVVSMTDVLQNKPGLEKEQIFRDRIVLIGATSFRFGEMFSTPYDHYLLGKEQRVPGIVIQANLTSQIISAALDGRPMIRVWSKQQKWLWIILWSFIGAIATLKLLAISPISRKIPRWEIFPLLLGIGSLFGISYYAFLWGWWLPVISPLAGFISAAIALIAYQHYQLSHLASVDSLTQLANRGYFDRCLNSFSDSGGKKAHLALILCDVDCFKLFNDTYGHQAGDDCLRQVAKAITQAVRHTDIVARYGGEEFVVILPDTNAETAAQVAERIRLQVKNLEIPHAHNKAFQYVTLSCGVASTLINADFSPAALINTADQALYQAKEQGRDRVLYALN